MRMLRSTAVLAAFILPRIVSGQWKSPFVPYRCHASSKVSFNEGESVPGIAHGIAVIEHAIILKGVSYGLF